MKQKRRFGLTGLGLATGLFSALFLLTQTTARAEAADAAFETESALEARSIGSPVGPPKRIIICHKGRHTIRVAQSAVPAHLAHGDTLGPCPEDTVICHKGRNTLIVSASAVPAHLAHGDTMGPCPNDVFMCNNLYNTIVVKAENVAEHLARGHRLGLCPDEALVCNRGKQTVRVNRRRLPEILARPGSYEGYCAGDQGPLISTNSLPFTVSAPR